MAAPTLRAQPDAQASMPLPLELRLRPQALVVAWSDGRTQILGARML